MTPIQDERGCLTDAGFQALERAAVGQAPAELAAHLAGCVRCQERVLARSTGVGGRPGAAVRRERRAPPPPWRVWVVLLALILTAAMVLATAHRFLVR